MKKFLYSIMLVGVSAFAATDAIVVKSNHSGFTAPEYTRSETCSVFADRVEIVRNYGEVTTTERRKVEVRDFANIVAGVDLEKVIEKENMLCDGPSTVIASNGHTLFSTGGCGSPQQDRQGPRSAILRDIVNAYCPLTHDSGPIFNSL